MPSYWRVAPRFWTDSVMRRASDDARLLALYLLTCPHRNVIGLFWLPKAYMCADLTWEAQRLAKPFGQLLTGGFLAYDEDAEVVLIRNALKYQSPENPNQVEAALRHIEDLPATFLSSEFRRLAERFSERLAKALPEGFGQPLPEPPTPATAPTPPQTTDNTIVDPNTADRPGTLPTEAAIREVWDAYLQARQSIGMDGPVRLTPKRRDKIRTRLKAFPLADVRDAAWGWTRDPWPDRRLHCDAAQVFKTDEHVEKFRDLWRRGPPQVMGRRTAEMARNAAGLHAALRTAEGGETDDGRRVGADRATAQRELPRPAG